MQTGKCLVQYMADHRTTLEISTGCWRRTEECWLSQGRCGAARGVETKPESTQGVLTSGGVMERASWLRAPRSGNQCGFHARQLVPGEAEQYSSYECELPGVTVHSMDHCSWTYRG